MASTATHITGIILSGGKSSRMGRDKGMVPLNDRPLVEFAAEVLRKDCDPILIGTNDHQYEKFGFPLVGDVIKGIGPIGGIYSCLEYSRTTDNFILSCDMPMISGDLVRYILEHRQHHDAVIPMFNGRPEPMCAYYRKEITFRLKDQIMNGVYKVQEVVKKLNTRYLDITSELDFYHDHLFANINSAADLEWMEVELRKRQAKPT